MWQVVDQVATIDLGGSANNHRYRTMAIAGANIISWLAANVAKLQTDNGRFPLIRIGGSPAKRPAQNELTKIAAKPRGTDLVNSCEQWLAVSGLTDEQISLFSTPRSSATTN